MTEREAQELLDRCEREEAVEADLAALAALLDAQEREPWIDALRQGLARELVDEALAGEVLDVVAPERERGLESALAALRGGLREERPEPGLADAVLAQVEPEETLGRQLSAFADGELDGAARETLAAVLAADPAARRALNAWARIGQELRCGLAAEAAAIELSPVWEAVSAELGIASRSDWTADLAEALRAEAGEVDLADRVMAELLPAVAPLRPVAVAQPVRPAARWWLRLPALTLLASAAALLLLLHGAPLPDGGGVQDPVLALAEPVLEIGATNVIEIEDLQVAEDAMVQVFQLDDGAPMVIFIDEGPGGAAPQGVTL